MHTNRPSPCEASSLAVFRRQRGWRWLAAGVAIGALGLVFLLYFKSQVVFDLATRVWSCF
jgi:hypothetical protein